jgi:gliding motility-associated-like protein
LVANVNFARYRWSTGDTTQRLLVDEKGTYSLIGVSQRACEYKSLGFSVEVIPCDYSIPNLFTPNGDQQNDVWKTREPFLKSGSVKVFNRWGQEVFSSSDPAFEWDGENVSAGNYFYLLEGNTVEDKAFKGSGWVTVWK